MAVELHKRNRKVMSPICETAKGTQSLADEDTQVVTSPICETAKSTQSLADEDTQVVMSLICETAESTQSLADEDTQVVMSPICETAKGAQSLADEDTQVVTSPICETAKSTQSLADEHTQAVMSPICETASGAHPLMEEYEEAGMSPGRAVEKSAETTLQEESGTLLEWENVTSHEGTARQGVLVTSPCEPATHAVGTRYRLLDVARGVTLLNMIAYHLLYDLVYIFGVAMPWYTSAAGYVWQQSICWTFIFISGLSCNLSHGNAARGVRLLFFGAVMTLVTWLVMPEQLVVFGVLSFLGCAGIIYALLEKQLKKIPAWLGMVVSAAAFLFTKGVPAGFVGVGDLALIPLPEGWYSIYAMFPVGFPTANFYSSDYFSIIPWIFLYLAGFFFWRTLRNRSLFELRGAIRLPILELTGRNTLPIYLAHQPLIYGVLCVAFRIIRY